MTTLDELERRVIPVEGCDLACWHRPGDGSRWVLWLHGACASARMWEHQLDAFEGYDHLFLDVRGQGESPMHIGERVDFEDVVDDIGAVLDDYVVDRAVVVGHSWGGNPAQEFAYRHPERTAALVMVGAWGQLRPMGETELRRITVMSWAYRAIPWRLVASVNARACSDVPATRASIAGLLGATGRQVFLDLGLTAYRKVHDVPVYPVHTPTLLVRGSLDSPGGLEPIYAAIRERNPAAREAVIDGTRHMPMIDTPQEFNRIIGEFLDGLPGSGKQRSTLVLVPD